MMSDVINYSEMEDGFISTTYGKIYFKHNPGTKQRLMLLHGLGGTTKAYAKFIENLPYDLDIYVIDLLGHGKSDKPKIDYTIEVQAAALNEFIKSINYGEFYLFGHSYGGLISIKYIIEFGSDRIAGVILEDSAGLRESENITEAYKQNMIKKALEFNNDRYVMESIMQQDNEVKDTDLKKIDGVKCLIIWGEKDNIINKSYGQKLNNIIKSSELQIIDNADHEPHYTNIEGTKHVLLDFIGYK